MIHTVSMQRTCMLFLVINNFSLIVCMYVYSKHLSIEFMLIYTIFHAASIWYTTATKMGKYRTKLTIIHSIYIWYELKLLIFHPNTLTPTRRTLKHSSGSLCLVFGCLQLCKWWNIIVSNSIYSHLTLIKHILYAHLFMW